ncbi:MAG: hypothetical protein ACOY93_13185 [Bacillota bacterium]
MSAAHQLAPLEPSRIGGTTAAPASRPSTRPAPKKKLRLVPLLVVGSIWGAAMMLCFSLISTSAAIRSASADIARMREEIQLLEQKNLELDGKIATAVSVSAVEAWAKSHNMKPPSGVVQTLQGKETAVADRRQPVPSQAQAREDRSLWDALLARFSRSPRQAAGAER